MSAAGITPTVDDAKLQEFMGRALGDMAACAHAPLVMIGDQLGLYKAMADNRPVTPGDLAQKTGTAERYVREWLNANAAAGYVSFDPEAKTYRLPPEQALALAVEDSPVFLPGAFQILAAMTKDKDKLLEAFRTGKGVGWHEHDHDLYQGTERFFRPSYNAHLVSSWIPALAGVEERLRKGGRVADVGCGFGSSTILMAKAYPNSEFFGFDYHAASIEAARVSAREAAVANRITFEVSPAKSYPGTDYDLVTFCDCLHDMGDPAGAARHTLQSLCKDGVWMIIEPYANEDVKDNLDARGRMFYSASTMLCVPCSLAQEVGLALGNQTPEATLRDLVTAAGFRSFRRATETPFNRVFEARA